VAEQSIGVPWWAGLGPNEKARSTHLRAEKQSLTPLNQQVNFD